MQTVVLAAGESSRFWPLNQNHKSVFKILGKPLIYYLFDGLERAGLREIIIIQNQARDVEIGLQNFKFPNLNLKYLVQKKPTGTGDAILVAEKLIKDKFFVINAERIDCQDYIKLILEKSIKTKKSAVVLASRTDKPWLFGILKAKRDKIIDIIEKPKPGKEPSNLKMAGIYLLPKQFLGYLKKTPKSDYSFPNALSKYAKQNELKTIITAKDTFALKYPWDLFGINEYLLNKNKAYNKGKMEKNCHIKGSLAVGKNTIIKSGTYVEGRVYIGENCCIGPNCFIRDFTSIGDNCRIGQGVEIKNSIIGDNSRIPHQSYIGDSIIGENCNIGGGTVFANLRFDHKPIKTTVKGEEVDTDREKFGAVLGSNVKIGINSSLMPGVLVGRNCIIGPHSAVYNNLKDNSVFYTKFQSIQKW